MTFSLYLLALSLCPFQSGTLAAGDLVHGTSVKSLAKIVRSGEMVPGENNIDGFAVYAERLQASALKTGESQALEGYAMKQALKDGSEPVLLRFKGLKADGRPFRRNQISSRAARREGILPHR